MSKLSSSLSIVLILLLSGVILSSCGSEPQEESNPHVPGFDIQNSDPQAIAIADQVMQAMGGRTAWDTTRFLRWTFFGNRHHVWDKQKGRVRIESPRENRVYLLNYRDMSGKVYENDSLITNQDSIPIYLEQARRYWINDSYWLVMPFKLKDKGVTLTYVGEDELPGGFPADILQLTFKAVGVTPQNKYHVWVDRGEHMVRQWAYFATAEEEEPRFTLPWLEYTQHGDLLLSGSRGEAKLSDIAAPHQVDDKAFTEL